NYRDGRDAVIIVDEAQLITDDAVFEEVRLLMNFQTDDRFLVTLLLFGSPELHERVRRLKHLDQRITIRYRLNTLDYTHTAAYVASRAAGAAGAVRRAGGRHAAAPHVAPLSRHRAACRAGRPADCRTRAARPRATRRESGAALRRDSGVPRRGAAAAAR